MQRRFTEEEEVEMVARYEGGEGSNTIAIDFDTYPSAVLSVVKRRGGEVRDKKTSQKSLLSESEMDMLCKMYLAGYTARYLSEKFKISERRVRKYLEKRGVSKNK